MSRIRGASGSQLFGVKDPISLICKALYRAALLVRDDDKKELGRVCTTRKRLDAVGFANNGCLDRDQHTIERYWHKIIDARERG